MNLARMYAVALHELSANAASESSLVGNLVSVLEKKGHQKLLPRIKAEYEKVEKEATRKAGVTIRIAHDSDAQSGRAKAAELLVMRGHAGAQIELCDDPTLVSGYVVSGPGFRYDASARAALIALYRQLTNSN